MFNSSLQPPFHRCTKASAETKVRPSSSSPLLLARSPREPDPGMEAVRNRAFPFSCWVSCNMTGFVLTSAHRREGRESSKSRSTFFPSRRRWLTCAWQHLGNYSRSKLLVFIWLPCIKPVKRCMEETAVTVTVSSDYSCEQADVNLSLDYNHQLCFPQGCAKGPTFLQKQA